MASRMLAVPQARDSGAASPHIVEQQASCLRGKIRLLGWTIFLWRARTSRQRGR